MRELALETTWWMQACLPDIAVYNVSAYYSATSLTSAAFPQKLTGTLIRDAVYVTLRCVRVFVVAVQRQEVQWNL